MLMVIFGAGASYDSYPEVQGLVVAGNREEAEQTVQKLSAVQGTFLADDAAGFTDFVRSNRIDRFLDDTPGQA